MWGYGTGLESGKPQREEIKIVGLSRACLWIEGMRPEVLGWLTWSWPGFSTGAGATEPHGYGSWEREAVACRGKGSAALSADLGEVCPFPGSVP